MLRLQVEKVSWGAGVGVVLCDVECMRPEVHVPGGVVNRLREVPVVRQAACVPEG